MPRAPRPHSHAPRPRQTREAPVHLGYGYDNCVGNFLEEFSEAQSRKQRPRQHVTVDQREHTVSVSLTVKVGDVGEVGDMGGAEGSAAP